MIQHTLTLVLLFTAGIAAAYELAIGAIFQNEEPYLKEWIEFHKLVGVDHFYLYNHSSTDGYLAVLEPYILSGEVELFDWPVPANSWNEWIHEVQPAAYVNCIKRAKGRAKWLALIDIDEFLTPTSESSILEILKDYEECAGVCFNWKTFGHSWLYEQPRDQLMIEALILRAPDERTTNLGVKSIVRPETVESCKHPHYVIYKEGFYHVNADKERDIDANGATARVHYDRLAVNHYWSRTGSYLYKKLKRYQLWFPEIDPEKWIEYVFGMNEVADHSMERFIVPLRDRL
jgi:glycosyl transferase family 92